MSNLQFCNMLTTLSHSHIIISSHYLIITLSHHHIITLSHYKSKHEEQVHLCKPERARGLNAFCEKGFDIIIIIIVIIIIIIIIIVIIIINLITLQGLKHRRRPSRTKDPIFLEMTKSSSHAYTKVTLRVSASPNPNHINLVGG